MAKGPICVLIRWSATPMRAEAFAEIWTPKAEAALRYGAHSWAFYRSLDGLHDFIQIAYFDSKLDFDRYWYSDEIAEARVAADGYYQVPLLPAYYEVVGTGAVRETPTRPEPVSGLPAGPGGSSGGPVGGAG